MDVIGLLAEIGLTERESKVYLGLLKTGLTTTGPLVKESGVPNSKIYEILESLQNKGLVSWIVKGKTKYFQASDPEKILTLFREKEKEVEENLIPLLKAKQSKSEDKQFVELFEGARAIFAFLDDWIEDAKKGENFYSFSLGDEHKDELVWEFYGRFGIKRAEKGLVVKIIVHKKNKELFKKIYSERWKIINKIIRFKDFDFPQGIMIFRDSVVMLEWGERPMGIHIRSKRMAEQYKKFFERLWKEW